MMHRDNGLACAGAAAHKGRAAVIAIGDLALVGMEKDPPAFQVAFEDATQFFFSFGDEDMLPALVRSNDVGEGWCGLLLCILVRVLDADDGPDLFVRVTSGERN